MPDKFTLNGKAMTFEEFYDEFEYGEDCPLEDVIDLWSTGVPYPCEGWEIIDEDKLPCPLNDKEKLDCRNCIIRLGGVIEEE